MYGTRRATLVIALIALSVAGAASPSVGIASPKNPLHGDWPQQGRDPQNTSFNKAETIITSGNVAQLVPEWKAPAPRQSGQGAVVANGLVYYAGDYGMSVYPLDCGTGGATCQPLWIADENGQRGPVAVGDLVLLGGGKLTAYPALGCGKPVCDPVMTFDVSGVWTITAAGDVIVVTTQTFSWDEVGLYVFDVSTCAADPCEPSWTAKIGPHESGSVAVANGSIYVGGDHNMYVFDLAGCGEDVCKGTWVGLTGSVGHADTTPTVADGFVYLLSAAVDPNNRSLSAYLADGCDHSTCKPTWGADVGGASAGASLAVADGKVFVSEYGQLAVFRTTGCGSKNFCEPRWAGVTDGLHPYPYPAVAGDVVYAGADAATIAAFATSCDTDICDPLTLLHAPEIGFANQVFVANGKLVVAGTDAIEVFGLP